MLYMVEQMINKNIAKKLCFYLVIYSKNAIFVSS